MSATGRKAAVIKSYVAFGEDERVLCGGVNCHGNSFRIYGWGPYWGLFRNNEIYYLYNSIFYELNASPLPAPLA